MIPLMMRLEVSKKRKKGVRLWLPVFLVWIPMMALMIPLLPLFILAALITWHTGYGRSLLMLFPMLWVVLFNLSGLGVDIKTNDEKFFMNFI
jgi:hypothetical protein